MCWNACLPNLLEKRNVTAITPSRDIQGHDFGTNRKLIKDFLLVINTYLLPCTVSKLWLIIGQIFARERGGSSI